MGVNRFFLLTHEREVDRPTSSSRVLLEGFGERCEQVVWSRTAPDPFSGSGMTGENTVVLYPSDNAELLDAHSLLPNCIVLEGTWQEARKIYNRSHYLRQYRAVRLPDNGESRYRLRRNQRDGGLSTLESVASVLRLQGEVECAENLLVSLDRFQQQQRPQAKKNPAG